MMNQLSSPGHILIADHTGNLDQFICNTIGQENWYIHQIDNVDDLNRFVLSRKPDIVILNAHLPDFSVQAFSHNLKQQFGEKCPHLILSIFTSVQEHLDAGFQAGVDDFLIVPFYAVEVITKINNYMNKLAVQRNRDQLAFELQKYEQDRLDRSAPKKMKKSVQLPPPPVPKGGKKKKKDRSKQENKDSAPVIPLFNNKRLSRSQEATSKELLRKNMTMLGLNIDGLEHYVDEFNPETSVALLEEVYQDLSGEIERFGGKLVSVRGDMLLAVFGSRSEDCNHRLKAVQAALQLQLKSMFFSERYLGRAKDMRVSVALHTGMVTLADIGSKDWINPVAVGAAMKVVTKLVNTRQSGDIIITKDTHGSISNLVYLLNERAITLDPDIVLEIADLKGVKADHKISYDEQVDLFRVSEAG